ncbi:hypothetical protein DBT_2206 [Dissulfuribacter thermophilus]|uniref:Uncharacterized protein n=1 Tax=Dissulfuribacter thermophilus TaxID=1156395 RepID=A0A1B9F389_9BACT|nr:hypothetical protein [Dissulfuribacter thermophilus]OCC14333.1 hypothetical protein DBT_2206 [Dissulfuribacter thermophilus]
MGGLFVDGARFRFLKAILEDEQLLRTYNDPILFYKDVLITNPRRHKGRHYLQLVDWPLLGGGTYSEIMANMAFYSLVLTHPIRTSFKKMIRR